MTRVYRNVADDLELSAGRADELAYHLVDGGRVYLEPVMVLGERRLEHFDFLFQQVQAGHCRLRASTPRIGRSRGKRGRPGPPTNGCWLTDDTGRLLGGGKGCQAKLVVTTVPSGSDHVRYGRGRARVCRTR